MYKHFTLQSIINAIQEMKLDTCPSDIVEVKMEHLEMMASKLLDLQNKLNTANTVTKDLNTRIELLNSLAKTSIKKKALEAYLKD